MKPLKAMVYTAPLTLEIQDVEEPTPGPGETMIEVRSVGICGSEREGFHSHSPFRIPPLIMGHEFAGIRVDTGEPVVINPLVSCGGCDLCLRGERNLCRSRQIIGIHRPGAFAQQVAVPTGNIYAIPNGMSFDKAALVEPMANGVHAYRLAQAHDPLPCRVGVIGAGMLGMAVTSVALHCGARNVFVSDVSTDRLRQAETLGAIPMQGALEGEFDLIFDAVGTEQTRADSVRLLRPGGTTIWIGLHGDDPGFDGLGLIRGEKSIRGTFCYHDRDFRAGIDLAEDFDGGWVAAFPLEAGPEVFIGKADIPSTSVKQILRPAS